MSDDEARELARRLRSYGDPIGFGVADRLERGVLGGRALIGTSVPEANVLLNVIERFVPSRLREVEANLADYVSRNA